MDNLLFTVHESDKKVIDWEEMYPVCPLLDKVIVSGEDTLVESEIEI
jgi:hypothetical protein